MNQYLFILALVFLPFFGFCQNFNADSVTCTCLEYSDWADSRAKTSKSSVSLKELQAVPALSETWVNYVSDYELEKDTLGRVIKLIRTYHDGRESKEISYSYDANNRLIQEYIHSESNSNGNFTYRDEKVSYTYDDFGRRNSKTTKVINGTNESPIEECHYIYDSKE